MGRNVAPQLAEDRRQLRHRLIIGRHVGEEGVLGADRLADTVGLDLAMADPSRNPVIVGPRDTEMLAQEIQTARAQVGAGLDAQPAHLGRRRRPDAMKLAHRQAGDKIRAARRGNDAQAVGLVLVRGDLGQELVVRHPGRSRQVRRFLDAGTDLLGDLGGRGHALQVVGDVEIGLVQRQGLDERRIVEEDFADLVRHLAINVEAVLDEDEVRAFALGGDRRHGRAHAVDARLIAGRRDDPAQPAPADGHGLAAQLRKVALLDRREKGIHVDMDDLPDAFRFGAVHALDLHPWRVSPRQHEHKANKRADQAESLRDATRAAAPFSRVASDLAKQSRSTAGSRPLSQKADSGIVARPW